MSGLRKSWAVADHEANATDDNYEKEVSHMNEIINDM